MAESSGARSFVGAIIGSVLLGACGGGASGPERVNVEPPTAASAAPAAPVAPEVAPAPEVPLHVLDGAEIAGEGSNPVRVAWSETMTNFSAFAVTFVVRDDRSAHYERVGSGARSQDYVVSEEAWTRMLDEVRAHDVCSLRSSGEFEHEDQTPTLVIAAPGLNCRIMLSDAEWYQDPRARPVKDAVARLFPGSSP